MHVSPISTNNNFKGLWGRPLHIDDVHGNEHHMIRENYHVVEYYPFLDDTTDFIKEEITSKNTFKENTNRILDNSGHPRYYITEKTGLSINQGEKLAFTKSEWKRYLSGKLSPKNAVKRLVEENLKRLKIEYLIK